jgi:hypothetical protein
MGSEVLYPIGFGLKWGLVIFLCLSLVYIVLFRFRNSSGHFEPPSDRFVILGGAIALGVTMAGAWWGLAALFRHFNRSLQPRVTSE